MSALIDGIPESATIGVSLIDGKGVALVTVLAIFISNIPEGLSSSANMRNSGRRTGFVCGLWSCLTLVLAISAWLGYTFLGAYMAFLQQQLLQVLYW